MRRKPCFLFQYVVLGISLILPADLSGQTYRFTPYTQEEGLPTASVDQMLRDKTGYFWLLSESDLVRFDGYDFKVYRNNPKDSTSLPESFVDMYMAADGTLYLRSVSAITRFDAVHGTGKRIVSAGDGSPV